MRSIKHIRILRIFLSAFSAWPVEIFGEKKTIIMKVLRVENPLQTVFLIIGQTFYIIEHLPTLDFFSIGDLIVTLLLSMLTLARTIVPNFRGYQNICRLFFQEFHLLNYKHRKGYFEQEPWVILIIICSAICLIVNEEIPTYIGAFYPDLTKKKDGCFRPMYYKVDKVSEYFSKFMMGMMTCGFILFNISPMSYNISKGAFFQNKPKNVSFQFSIYYEFPGFDPSDFFLITSALNFYFSWTCAISVCALDLFLCLMVVQIIAHIKILNYNIEHMCDIGADIEHYSPFTDEENRELDKRLKDCVNHHRDITRFVNGMSKFFGPLLAVNYGFHLVGCCLLLLECSSLSAAALIRFGPLTAIIFGQLIIISVTFEVVNSESNKLSDAVYATAWEKMDIRNQVSLCIILREIQEPLKVTALGLTDVSVRTMASILKATFSYFAFLKSIDN